MDLSLYERVAVAVIAFLLNGRSFIANTDFDLTPNGGLSVSGNKRKRYIHANVSFNYAANLPDGEHVEFLFSTKEPNR